MKITQISSRAIRIQTEGGSIVLPYRLSWNGHDRLPESIVLEDDRVQAFFLFATVKDVITEDGNGLRIERSWSIMTPGTIRLTIDADFTADGASFLFPGVSSGDATEKPVSFIGERTSLPSSVLVFTGTYGAFMFTDFPADAGDAAGIGARRLHGEDGTSLAVEVRIPAVEEPQSVTGPRPGNSAAVDPETLDIKSTGSLSRRLTLNVVFASRKAAVERGMAAGLARMPMKALPVLPGPDVFRAALIASLETHLQEGGGVMGLREVPDGRVVSASASLETALQLLSWSDPQKIETAQRLSDFCLKGQHPSGLLYESYSLERGEWVGASGTLRSAGKAADPLIPLAESARIADLLLQFSEGLSVLKLPGEKYRYAGERFVECFLDEKGKLRMPGALCCPGGRESAEKGLSGFEVFFPFQRMFRLTGRDKYRKALGSLASDFLSRDWDAARPPSWREGRAPDSRAALLCGRLAVEIARAGLGEPDADVFLSLLAPWVHVNRPARAQAADPVGGIADSFECHRLLFAGAETAYVLLSLSAMARSKEARSLAADLARVAFASSLHAPIGTAFFQHTRWDRTGKEAGWERGLLGPVDCRRLAREAHFAALVYEEHPAWTRGGAVAPARAAHGVGTGKKAGGKRAAAGSVTRTAADKAVKTTVKRRRGK